MPMLAARDTSDPPALMLDKQINICLTRQRFEEVSLANIPIEKTAFHSLLACLRLCSWEGFPRQDFS